MTFHADEYRVVCIAEPFAIEPTDARSIERVRKVYALVYCAAADPGTPFDFAERTSGPVAVRLIPTIRLELPDGDDDAYVASVRKIIPGPYVGRALAGFNDPVAATAELRNRFAG